MFRWFRKLFRIESEADIVDDMNRFTREDYKPPDFHINNIPQFCQTEPMLKPIPFHPPDTTVAMDTKGNMHAWSTPIPRPPMKPTVHPPIDDEDDDGPGLLDVAEAVIDAAELLSSESGGRDDSSSSSSNDDWSGGGGGFDGGGASGDW